MIFIVIYYIKAKIHLANKNMEVAYNVFLIMIARLDKYV